ncbi:biotin/lipoyl-containing protein, partial [Staphylococcus saprophyticus]
MKIGEGECVRSGEGLLISEGMKMERTIEGGFDGVVKKVRSVLLKSEVGF